MWSKIYHIKLCIKDSKHVQGVENTLSQKESIKIFCERVQFLIKQLDLIKNDLLTYILKHFVSILRNCILRFKVPVLSPIFKNLWLLMTLLQRCVVVITLRWHCATLQYVLSISSICWVLSDKVPLYSKYSSGTSFWSWQQILSSDISTTLQIPYLY